MSLIVLILILLGFSLFIFIEWGHLLSPRLFYSAPKNKDYIYTSYTRSNTMPTDFIVFDVETTGLKVECDEIIQLSAIKFIDGIEVDHIDTYINPRIAIPKIVSNINGISNAHVRSAPTIDKVLPLFLNFIEAYPLMAHNASFDMKFIQTALINNGYNPLSNEVIDTLSLARKYIETPNHKLTTLKEFLGINIQSHNAINDCYVTSQVYFHCCNLAETTDEPCESIDFSHTNDIATTYLPNIINATDEELSCYQVIKKLLEGSGKDISILRYSKNSTYFDVLAFHKICRIRFMKKRKYVLIERKYLEYKDIPLTISEATKSEGDAYVRIFFNSPEEIYHLKKALSASFDCAVYSMDLSAENSCSMADYKSLYLSDSLDFAHK